MLRARRAWVGLCADAGREEKRFEVNDKTREAIADLEPAAKIERLQQALAAEQERGGALRVDLNRESGRCRTAEAQRDAAIKRAERAEKGLSRADAAFGHESTRAEAAEAEAAELRGEVERLNSLHKYREPVLAVKADEFETLGLTDDAIVMEAATVDGKQTITVRHLLVRALYIAKELRSAKG